ncbi:hypothetical protein DAMA08_000910 [Martiniozyma asiatica (nom. inval.)]|nr:hypothetical protein DAMA08_000910 [Martiniozyma asiatica]
MSMERRTSVAFCGVCNGVSWTGQDQEVKQVMNSHPKSSWCTCTHVVQSSNPEYPPRASTGDPVKLFHGQTNQV